MARKNRAGQSHYRLHGIDGLRPKRSAYSAQSKLQVLSHHDWDAKNSNFHKLLNLSGFW
jgi:transposase